MNGPEQQREAAMTLRLPDQRLDHWRDRFPDLLSRCSQPIVDLACGDWVLTCSDLADLCAAVSEAGHQLGRITGHAAETVVSASALGLDASRSNTPSSRELQPNPMAKAPSELLFHHGTLRSGIHIAIEKDGALALEMVA